MAQEIERVGIATALITSLDTIAVSMGSCRIVRGAGVTHVAGDPSLTPTEESARRRRIVALALEALQSAVERPRVLVEA